ncbi:MAG: FAD-dependent oxidoreductase [Spirochaetales bacterium]
MKRLVILGNGMAAGKLVQELVRRGYRDQITLVGAEGPGVFNRILLTPYLTQPPKDDFWLVTPEWLAEHKVETLNGLTATAIDRDKKLVHFEGGRTEAYDTLVLALGSRPFLPPIAGVELPGVHTLRSLTDAERFRAELPAAKQVLVIGGGLIGLETALELHRAGYQVTVAHGVPGLMERHLELPAANVLRRHLEASGLKVLTEVACTALEAKDGRVNRAVFRDGATLDTDLVLVSTGAIPVTGLASAAGLAVGRGIQVNDQLLTADANIYAVGECLEWKGRTWGLQSSTYEQAQTLAQVLAPSAGAPTAAANAVAYQPSDFPPTRLKAEVFTASLGALGSQPGDDVLEFTDPARGVYKKVVVRQGKIVGAQAVGSLTADDPDRWDSLEVAYATGQVLTRSAGELLFAPVPMDATVAKSWPDNLRVCNCNGVSAGDIREAIANGCLTPEAVMKTTRAGTGCSTCRGRLRLLVEAEVGSSGKKDSAWKRFRRAWREKEIRGFTPYWIVSYFIDFVLLFCAVAVLVTGIIKFPGFLAWLFQTMHDLFPDAHFSVRRLTMEAEKLKDLLAWWHDWGGLVMTGAVVLHLVIHWSMMLSFVRSMLTRKRK